MFLRIFLLATFSLFVSFVIVGSALAINFFWILCEPIVASIFVVVCLMVVFGCGYLLAKGLRPSQDGSSASARMPVVAKTLIASIPILSAAGSGIAIASALAMTWNLPRSGEDTISSIPKNQNLISFKIDDRLLIADLAKGKISNWKTQNVSTVEQVTQEEFCLYNRRLINRSGKCFDLDFPTEKSTFASKIKITKPKTHINYQVTGYNKENDEAKGLWLRPLDGQDGNDIKFSHHGWDPVWTRDGSTAYLCDGIGVARVVDGKLDYVFKSTDEFSPCELALSDDDQWLAFRIKSKTHGRNAINKIAVMDPDNTVQEIFTGKAGEIVDQPTWSHDGQKIAFRFDGTRNAVRTLMVADRNGNQAKLLHEFQPGAMLQTAGVQSFAWSPDDRKIAMIASLRGMTMAKNEAGMLSHKFDLYIINSDGTDFRRLTKIRQTATSHNSWPIYWW